MFYNLFYKLGRRFVLIVPLKFSYRIAQMLADIHCAIFFKERTAVAKNLKIIFGKTDTGINERELKKVTREVFINFAKYLVDFLRFEAIDDEYIKNHIKLVDLHNLEEALKQRKGVIILSAHLGNWELGGYVLGRLGYSINAVVLSHKDEKVNEFFINQRGIGNFKSIEIGASLRVCYKALKNNELLALLGDRNFSSTGLRTEFFGIKALMPKGPAALSIRTGAVILPTYVVREKDDAYKIVFEKPIYPKHEEHEEAAVENLMKAYLPSLENAIRKYPHQWYVFRYFWENV